MENSMAIGVWYHLITVIPLILFKLAVLMVGYLIAKLGHDLLIKGVTGEFKFNAEIKGVKADLISVSPGIFFILMATVMITVAIVKDKPFETKVTKSIEQMVESRGEKNENGQRVAEKPAVRATPPGKEEVGK